MQVPFLFIICGKRGILSPLRFESDFVDDEPPSGSHPSPAAFAFFNKKRDLFASLFPFYHLRKERDSNPRYSYPYTAFRVRPDRPLRHLSECGCKGSVFFADNQKKSIFFALYVAFFLRMSKKVHFTSFYVLRN